MAVSALISFIEQMQAKALIQTKIEIKVKKKNMIGTSMIRLVVARKSAAASMTSIASFKDLKPKVMQQQKVTERIPVATTPAK